jgi:hypothetical protein
MTKEQYNILINLIDEYGEAEEEFGVFCCNTTCESVNSAYSEILNYLNTLIEERN